MPKITRHGFKARNLMGCCTYLAAFKERDAHEA